MKQLNFCLYFVNRSNIYTHHSRLWNKILGIRPIVPRRMVNPFLSISSTSNNKVYYVLCEKFPQHDFYGGIFGGWGEIKYSFVSFVRNNYLSLHLQIHYKMSNNKLQVVLLDDAIEFIQSLPSKVQKKIAYNYLKIEQGI